MGRSEVEAEKRERHRKGSPRSIKADQVTAETDSGIDWSRAPEAINRR